MPSSIATQGLGKRYDLGHTTHHSHLRDAVADTVLNAFRRLRGAPATHAERPSIWALRNVSFEVQEGEILGIIGPNGAGKSTLLRILSDITAPTEGRVTLRGRVGSLLEIGTGFHGELTGRENIYLSGTILGLRRSEIDRKFDAIVAFAEVERFLDTPVKRYSSGMYVRLGFAVAAHLEPEILLVDEVLAVGDAAFQRKCLGTMDDAARGGRTILFVSHNMAAVQRLCSRAILLDGGRVCDDGRPEDVVSGYLHVESRPRFQAVSSTGAAQLLEADLRNENGYALSQPRCTAPIAIHVRFALVEPEPGASLDATVLSRDGLPLFTLTTRDAQIKLPSAPGEYELRALVPANALLAGDYHLGLCLRSGDLDPLDQVEPALSFTVDPGDADVYAGPLPPRGSVQIPCTWAHVDRRPGPDVDES